MDHFHRGDPPAYAIWSQFAPSRDGGLSIQEQLVRFFRREVTTGALRPESRPASRALAQELKLARGTVSGAYERLAAEVSSSRSTALARSSPESSQCRSSRRTRPPLRAR